MTTKLYGLSFGCGKDFYASRSRARPQVRDELVQLGIAPQGIMMGQCQAANPSGSCDRDGIFDRAVTPAGPALVLLGRELGVVNEEIGGLEEFAVPPVPSGQLAFARGKFTEKRLVVRCVGYASAVGLQAESQGERGVVHVAGLDVYVVDLKFAFTQLVKADIGGHLVQTQGKIGVLHLSGERLLQR